MRERELERLFLDFRERGDVSALAKVFDRTSDELLTVALHLVTEPAQAEDVVQATFLTAIQRAETFDATREVRPWLVGILANQAARLRHERARAIDPTRLESRAQPDPSEEIERAEVAQILLRAVDDLPEPYRAAVRRHVLDGERAVDIARQSGIAAGTVRMHILRGLERLRRALPATMFGAGAWSVRGSDSVRSVVLEAARAKARILAASASTSTATGISATLWTMGGLLVTTKILLGVGALAVAALFLWNLSPARSPTDIALSAPSSAVDPLAPLSSATAQPETARQSASVDPATASASSMSASGWWLTGSVSGLDSKPAELTKITVRRIMNPPVSGMCDATGRFDIDVGALFEGSVPTELIVAADHPANRRGTAIVRVSSADAERGRSARVDLATDITLEPFALVKGRVECVGDASHGRPQVKVFPVGGRRDLDMVFPTLVDPDTGSFVIGTKETGVMWLRAACVGRLALSRNVDVVLGETADVGVLRLEEGDASIEGRVILPFEHAAGDYRVLAVRGEPSKDRYFGYQPDAEFEGIQQFASVDETGRFSIRGITRGTWQVFLWDADRAFRSSSDPHIFDAAVPCTAPVAGLQIGADLGRLVIATTSKGKPRPGITVSVHGADNPRQESPYTDKFGRTSILVSMKVDLDLDLKSPGFDPVHVTLPSTARAPDMVQAIEVPDSGHGTLVLRPHGAAPPNVLVRLSADVPGARHQSGSRPVVLRLPTKLVEGVYTVADVPAGEWNIVVIPSAPNWLDGGGEFLTDATSSATVDDMQMLVLPIEFRDAGRVRFEIEGWSGKPGSFQLEAAALVDGAGNTVPARYGKRMIEDARLIARPEGVGVEPAGLSTSWAYEMYVDAPNELVQGILPGDYRITLDGKNWVSSTIPFHVQAGVITTVHMPVRKR